MYEIVNRFGRVYGLPAYTCPKAAQAAARELSAICGEPYRVVSR